MSDSKRALYIDSSDEESYPDPKELRRRKQGEIDIATLTVDDARTAVADAFKWAGAITSGSLPDGTPITFGSYFISNLQRVIDNAWDRIDQARNLLRMVAASPLADASILGPPFIDVADTCKLYEAQLNNMGRQLDEWSAIYDGGKGREPKKDDEGDIFLPDAGLGEDDIEDSKQNPGRDDGRGGGDGNGPLNDVPYVLPPEDEDEGEGGGGVVDGAGESKAKRSSSESSVDEDSGDSSDDPPTLTPPPGDGDNGGGGGGGGGGGDSDDGDGDDGDGDDGDDGDGDGGNGDDGDGDGDGGDGGDGDGGDGDGGDGDSSDEDGDPSLPDESDDGWGDPSSSPSPPPPPPPPPPPLGPAPSGRRKGRPGHGHGQYRLIAMGHGYARRMPRKP